MTTLLEVHDLAKSFGGVTAVNGVSFSLEEGQLLAIIGPNGAGKSTCFNLINGQLDPDRGSVLIMGKDATGLKPRHVWRLGVGRTFQVTATFASMTVMENVQVAVASRRHHTKSLFNKLKNLYVEESMNLLELVGIAELCNRPCGVLAYGDLKRVELAVALANEPRLLLMDEPTAGMGPAESSNLMNLTAEIVQTRNIGVLFTEHDMDVVFAHAHRVIVLNRGELIAEGYPDQIRENSSVQDIYLGRG